eukprot:CAMPEP_0194340766 /NCGR_PEP_ID=MMETSP0171-20130528/87520_1 /TAXON_ID=218684 /ORGANISM="Corethron pennatum, Strain L29A3" /LENGTH=52 /DNA_ID=CAMNT_0039105851 /DNA_START=801 /DNA_END=959 /DNA_ORIENTATION=+
MTTMSLSLLPSISPPVMSLAPAPTNDTNKISGVMNTSEAVLCHALAPVAPMA